MSCKRGTGGWKEAFSDFSDSGVGGGGMPGGGGGMVGGGGALAA